MALIFQKYRLLLAFLQENRFLTESLKFLQDFIHFFVIFWLTSLAFRINIYVYALKNKFFLKCVFAFLNERCTFALSVQVFASFLSLLAHLK